MNNNLLVPRLKNHIRGNYILSTLPTFYADLWNPEQQGFCMHFDGVDDQLSNATANFRSADSQGAIEVWFKTSVPLTAMAFVSSSDEATNNLYRFYFGITSATGSLTVVQKNNDTASQMRGGTVVTDGQWHHAVLSSNGTAWSIILDGVTESLTTVAGTNDGDWFADTNNRDSLTIGVEKDSTPVAYMNGEIGFTRIYSRPMLEAEAMTNFQRGRKATASDTTGLVFNLPMTEGTGNPVDTVGSLTMTVTGAVWVEALKDKSVNALDFISINPTWSNQGRTFNTLDDLIYCAPHASINDLTSGLTIIAWIKPITLGESTTTIIVGKSTNATPTSGWIIFLSEVVAGQPSFGFRADHATTDIRRFGVDNLLAYNTWQMITVTWTGGAAATTIILYKNGVESASYQMALNAVGAYQSDAACNLTIGNEPGKTQTFDGTIGDALLYNRVLPQGEINQIYNATRARYNA